MNVFAFCVIPPSAVANVATNSRPPKTVASREKPPLALIANGTARKIIVVGADKMSSIIDYPDRATRVLFGDGAGPVLLEPDNHGYGIMDALIRSIGQAHV